MQTDPGPLVALMCTENPASIATLQNKDVYCGVIKPNHFYFYFTSSNSSESFSLIRSDAHKIMQSIIIIMSQVQKCIMLYVVVYSESLLMTPSSLPSPIVPPPIVNVTNVTSSQVMYETTAHGSATRVITGYEVFRFGVPMIGEYVNTGRRRRVPISPAVPGAQYRITAWRLGDSRSAIPAVESVTTAEASESTCTQHMGILHEYSLQITGDVLQNLYHDEV